MKTLLDYEVISVIGSGSFATCFKVRDKNDGKIFAWKAIPYDENRLNDNGNDDDDDNDGNNDGANNDDDQQSIKTKNHDESLIISEIDLLRQLKHPNIVQYYDHIINREIKTIYILMEYCEGGDLAKLILKCRKENKQFEEKYIWRVLYQISKAVNACHSNKVLEGAILHRDIKPANVFLDSKGNIKLGDFGLARLLQKHESYAQSFVGTPYYMSPEMIKGDKYEIKSDVWSIGCLIYEICALKPPFYGKHLKQLSKHISDGSFHRIPENYSDDLQAMITFLLSVDNGIRPTIEVILRHPILVHHASMIDNEFPKLIPSSSSSVSNDKLKQKLNFSPDEEYLSNTLISNCTSLLRSELFDSSPANKDDLSIDPKYQITLLSNTLKDTIAHHSDSIQIDPDIVTRNIFDDVLKNRLQAIRAQESLLNQKEANLKEKEIELNKREKRLTTLEKSLEQKKIRIDSMMTGRTTRHTKRSRSCASRKQPSLDDTYCSIEPNEANKFPTVAKLDLTKIPPLKALPSRKVTFKSPQKLVKYNIENVPSIHSNQDSKSLKKKNDLKKEKSVNSLVSSTSSRTSEDSTEHTQKRRSILSSIFGMNHSKSKGNKIPENACPLPITDQVEMKDLNKMWTLEHKKAAFEMLAAMNSNSTKETNNEDEKRNSLNRRRSFDRKSQLRKSVAVAMEGRHQIFI